VDVGKVGEAAALELAAKGDLEGLVHKGDLGVLEDRGVVDNNGVIIGAPPAALPDAGEKKFAEPEARRSPQKSSSKFLWIAPSFESCIWSDCIAAFPPAGPSGMTSTKTSCACACVLVSASASSLGHQRQPGQIPTSSGMETDVAVFGAVKE
jgi:hypothetical protein